MNRESALHPISRYGSEDESSDPAVFGVNWGWLHGIQFGEPRGSERFKMFLSNCVSRQSRCSATQTWPDLNLRNVF